MLVAAGYEPTAWVDLAFDRAVDVGGIDPSAVRVWDGPDTFLYAGVGAVELVSPTTVRVFVTGVEDFAGEGVTMTVGSDNGIVAADDGGAWAGVTDLPLPWP